jgi:hypothetical protein
MNGEYDKKIKDLIIFSRYLVKYLGKNIACKKDLPVETVQLAFSFYRQEYPRD